MARRQRASCSAKPPRARAWRAPEGPQGLAVAPERSEGRAAGHAGRGARGRRGLAGQRAEAPIEARGADGSRRGRPKRAAPTPPPAKSRMQFPRNMNRHKLKNRRISMIRNQTSTCAHGNYVRNCWLTAIAGHQGNAPSRRAEPLIEARGADGSRAAHGAARPHGRARLPENPRAHKQQPASHSNT